MSCMQKTSSTTLIRDRIISKAVECNLEQGRFSSVTRQPGWSTPRRFHCTKKEVSQNRINQCYVSQIVCHKGPLNPNVDIASAILLLRSVPLCLRTHVTFVTRQSIHLLNPSNDALSLPQCQDPSEGTVLGRKVSCNSIFVKIPPVLISALNYQYHLDACDYRTVFLFCFLDGERTMRTLRHFF